MAKVAGTAYFNVEGTQYSVRGGITLSLGAVERETIVGSDGLHGIKEMPRAAFIECDITDRPDIDLNRLASLGPVTVTVEMINGKKAVLRDAFQVNNIELDTAEGQLTVKFEGQQGEYFS